MELSKTKVPQTPGVYFFRNKQGQILYIGKALNLKKRVASYFKNNVDSRIKNMLEMANKITWQETSSEIEALILESQFIKKHRPPFNIKLRDDKQYFYVGITKDKFPRIFITHQPTKNQDVKLKSTRAKADFSGPFTDGSALKTTLGLLRRIFPYCTCKQKHNNYCLNYHIGKCLGFCCLKNNPELVERTAKKNHGYRKNIRAVKDVLSGKKNLLIKKLKKEMSDMATKENFQKAAETRDKMAKLEKVFENALIIRKTEVINISTTLEELVRTLKLSNKPERIEGYDVANIQGQFATGSMVVFINGSADKTQYRKFKIHSPSSPNDVGMLKEVLARRFNHSEWIYPDLIIMDGGIAQLNIAKHILKIIGQNKIRVITLTKDDRHIGTKIFIDNKKTALQLSKISPSARNLILQIDAEAHRFAINYYRKLHGRLSPT